MDPPASRRAAPEAPVKPGDLLAGKYRVDRVLGAGGMGIVVAATHIDLKQKVALKFLLPRALANPQNVERFVREGRAAANLKSQHVARVIDVGRMGGGEPYIVMEYLEGADLGAALRNRGKLAVTEAIGHVLQACEAVAEAHAAQLVHRDLKPENLFLTRSVDGAPMVKVLDFGISKSLDEEEMNLTQTSSMVGSPAYMSPEQMRSSKSVDRRADIWSLGVILYELTTGALPYRAESLADLAFKVAEGAPKSPNLLRPEIQGALADVILKCLARERDKRWASVGELANALEPFAAPPDRNTVRKIQAIQEGGLPPLELTSSGDAPVARSATMGAWGTTQYPDGTAPPRTPPKRSRWPLFAMGAGGLALLLIGIGVGATRSREPAPQASAKVPEPPPVPATSATVEAKAPPPPASADEPKAIPAPSASVADRAVKPAIGVGAPHKARPKAPPQPGPSATTATTAAPPPTVSNGFIKRARMRFKLTAILVLAQLVAAGAARGEEPPADQRARAQQLFDSALADVDRGDFAKACPKFLASQRADPKTSTLLNLGACYERNGQTASAWGAFREGEASARKIAREDWAKIAADRVRALEGRLVRLTISAPTPPPAGLVVERDGAPLDRGEWGVAIPVDPGEHVVSARAEGKKGWSTKVLITESAPATITVPVLADVEKTPEVVRSPVVIIQREPGRWTTPRIAGVAAGAAGVASLGVGAFLGLNANATYKDARSSCAGQDPNQCSPQAVADSRKAYDRAQLSTIFFVAGGVLAAGGAALYFLPPVFENKKTAHVHLVPRSGGAALEGAF